MGRLCGLQRNATHTLILSTPVTLIDSEVIVAPLFLDCEASCNSAYRNQGRQPLRISFRLSVKSPQTAVASQSKVRSQIVSN
jgi:hypothetical protein